MARVDAIVQQQRAGQINLECGLVATTFQHQCQVILKKRRATEAMEAAAAVASSGTVANAGTVASAGTAAAAVGRAGTVANAGTVASAASLERGCNFWACSDCKLNDEVRAAEEYTSDDEDIQAAQAYLASEDAAFAHDVAVGERVAADLALDEVPFPDHEYDDYDNYECTCEERFGLDDDGEVEYHECR